MPRTVYLIALVAAFSSAGATIFVRHGLRGSNALAALWINVVVGTLCLWLGVLLTGGVGHVSASGIALFMLAGLIGTIGGRPFVFAGIHPGGAPTRAPPTHPHP